MQDISKGDGRTVLFVSHDITAIKSLCTRTIVLEYGKTVFEGGTNEGVDFYLFNDNKTSHSYKANSYALDKPFIKSVNVITNNSNGLQEFNEDLKIEITVFSPVQIKSPAVSFQILNRDNIPIIHELILNQELEFCQEEGDYILTSTIRKLKLYQGNYKLNIHFADNFSKIKYDNLTEVCDFEIINTNKRPYYWQLGSAIYKENETSWAVKNIKVV